MRSASSISVLLWPHRPLKLFVVMRIGLYLYNTADEVEYFLEIQQKIAAGA